MPASQNLIAADNTDKNTPDSWSSFGECVESDPVLVWCKSCLLAVSEQNDTYTVHTLLMKTSRRQTGHKSAHDHNVQWEVQAVVVVLGCNDAPLGGDRVLQCGSLRTSEAPLSGSFTCDDSMPPCCLCVHASQNAAAAVENFSWAAPASGKRKTSERPGVMKQPRWCLLTSRFKLERLSYGYNSLCISMWELTLPFFSHPLYWLVKTWASWLTGHTWGVLRKAGLWYQLRHPRKVTFPSQIGTPRAPQSSSEGSVVRGSIPGYTVESRAVCLICSYCLSINKWKGRSTVALWRIETSALEKSPQKYTQLFISAAGFLPSPRVIYVNTQTAHTQTRTQTRTLTVRPK